jgi:hypothetical protein
MGITYMRSHLKHMPTFDGNEELTRSLVKCLVCSFKTHICRPNMKSISINRDICDYS